MSKVLAIFCTIMLHAVFVAGFTATGVSATQIASERAAHASMV